MYSVLFPKHQHLQSGTPPSSQMNRVYLRPQMLPQVSSMAGALQMYAALIGSHKDYGTLVTSYGQQVD